MTRLQPQDVLVPDTAPSAPQPTRLPLLASTHFCLDVLLQGSLLDLESVVEIIAFDPCACTRVLGAAEKLSASADERWGLKECVIALGRAGLVHTLAYEACTWHEQTRLHAFASDAVSVGRAAQALAPALSLHPQEAYTVGLLHAMDRLPAVLNDGIATPSRPHYAFTGWLGEALAALHPFASPPLWYHLVLAAHQVDIDTDAALDHPDLQQICRCGLLPL